MNNQQINDAIYQAEIAAEPTIHEISTELRQLTCFPKKRLRILELLHVYAQEVARAALTQQTQGG